MSSDSLAPGALFAGDFEIQRRLSEGGMGVVFLARQRSTGALRALKVMQPTLLASNRPEVAAKNRARFEAEARVGSTIRSEHVVQVIAAGVDETTGAPWLAMELLEGVDLATELDARGRIPPTELIHIFQQLTHALAQAHRAGVVHLDLKPENIFLANSHGVDSARRVKVLDFGIAKILTEHRQSATVTTAIGSPFWMAPEQAQPGSHVGPATDLWALGLIAFRALTGRCYWRSANVEPLQNNALLFEMMALPLEPASTRAQHLGCAQHLPPDFDAWFARCVDRDPRARFASADDAMNSLRPILSRTPAIASSPVPNLAFAPTLAAPPVAPPAPPAVAAPWPPALVDPTRHAAPVSFAPPGPSRTTSPFERPATATPPFRPPWVLPVAAVALLAVGAGSALLLVRHTDTPSPTPSFEPATTPNNAALPRVADPPALRPEPPVAQAPSTPPAPPPAPQPEPVFAPPSASGCRTRMDFGSNFHLRPSDTPSRTGAWELPGGAEVEVLSAGNSWRNGNARTYFVRVVDGPGTGRTGYVFLHPADLAALPDCPR